MNIIPAIDIQNGKCVRLTQGMFNTEKIYSDDPVAIAKQWEYQGAKQLHIVDLDGAKDGNMKNFNIIKNIVKNVAIPMQVGGGIRDEKIAQRLFDIGVKNIILGSIFFDDSKEFKNLIKKYKEKIIVALDVKNEIVMTRGWIESSKKTIWNVLELLENSDIKKIMITDIGRDGTLKSPNFSFLKRCLQITDIDIIASGGVSSQQDIEELKNIGITEIIVGKALYEGRINLSS